MSTAKELLSVFFENVLSSGPHLTRAGHFLAETGGQLTGLSLKFGLPGLILFWIRNLWTEKQKRDREIEHALRCLVSATAEYVSAVTGALHKIPPTLTGGIASRDLSAGALAIASQKLDESNIIGRRELFRNAYFLRLSGGDDRLDKISESVLGAVILMELNISSGLGSGVPKKLPELLQARDRAFYDAKQWLQERRQRRFLTKIKETFQGA